MQPNQMPSPPQPERQPDRSIQEATSPGLERAPIESSREPAATPLPPVSDAAATVPATHIADDQAAVVPAPIQSPLEAKDGDNIEPVWVERVDEIIEKQANDPYEQEEAAEKTSQEYLKGRFNIDIDGAN